MDAQILKVVGRVAGIGGLALGVFLLLFKDLLKKIVAPKMTPEHWFKVVIIFMVLVWSIAVLGIGPWVLAGRENTVAAKHKPTDPFTLYTLGLATGSSNYIVDSFRFPYSDIEANRDYKHFTDVVLANLPPYRGSSVKDLAVFRIDDKVPIDGTSRADVVSEDNLGVIVIPKSIITSFGSSHLAFTYAKSAADRLR